MSGLSAEDLRDVLDSIDDSDVLVCLWAARTYEELGRAARLGLSVVGVWARPGGHPWQQEYEIARSSLISYVLGSTMNVRIREFYDQRAWLTDAATPSADPAVREP
jgi:hypothetical protein